MEVKKKTHLLKGIVLHTPVVHELSEVCFLSWWILCEQTEQKQSSYFLSSVSFKMQKLMPKPEKEFFQPIPLR